MAPSIELDPECVRALVTAWNRHAAHSKNGSMLPRTAIERAFVETLRNFGVGTYSSEQPDGWRVGSDYTRRQETPYWAIIVSKQAPAERRRYGYYEFPASTHASLVSPNHFDLSSEQNFDADSNLVGQNHFGPFASAFLRVARLNHPYFEASDASGRKQIQLGTIDLGLQGEDYARLLCFLSEQIIKHRGFAPLSWAEGWQDQIGLPAKIDERGVLRIAFPGGLSLQATTANVDTRHAAARKSLGSSDNDEASCAAMIEVWTSNPDRQLLLALERVTVQLPASRNATLDQEFGVQPYRSENAPPLPPPREGSPGAPAFYDYSTQTHSSATPAAAALGHASSGIGLAAVPPPDSIEDVVIRIWSQLYHQNRRFDNKELQNALRTSGIDSILPRKPEHQEFLYVRSGQNFYYMVPAPYLQHNTQQSTYYRVTTPCSISLLNELGRAGENFAPRKLGKCVWLPGIEPHETNSQTQAVTQPNRPPDHLSSAAGTRVTPLRLPTFDSSTSRTPTGVQPNPPSRTLEVAAEIVRRWQDGWTKNRQLLSIREELANVAGVTRVFKSETLQLYVCVVFDITGIGVPCNRDYDNNRQAFDADRPDTSNSRVCGLLTYAEVSPSGETVVARGRVAITD
jgi:hypothetical protein